MTKKLDGNWQLAHKATPGNLVPGRLTLPLRGAAQLRVYGALARDLTEGALRDHQRIVGVIDRRPWTLENCFPVRYNHFNDQPELWNVELALSGVDLDEEQELLCDIAQVTTKHLRRFIDRSGLRMERPDNTKPFDGALYVSLLPDESHPFAGGAVTVKHQIRTTGPGKIDTPSIGQNFAIRLDLEVRQPYRETIAALGDFQDLISIAANRPAEYEKMLLVSNDVPMAMLNGPHKTAKEQIEVYADWTARDKKKELWQSEYVFQYDDLDGVAGLAAWADYSQQYRLITRRVIATRNVTGMYVSDRFNNRIAALEAWDHKVTGGNKGGSLERRLRRLIQRAGPVFEEFIADPRRWIRFVKETRNGVAHHDESILTGSSSDQYCLAESLYWLYVILALRAVNAPDSTITRIANHGDFAYWRDRMHGLISRLPPS